MQARQSKTPVLFLVFNRPEETRAAFAAIRKARPEKLWISADGPRPGQRNEDKLCEETRKIATAVDWPCEVTTRFLETNAGCAKTVEGALKDFFSQEKEGIVLEDDCIAHPDFFPFCAELLERYRDDERISAIGGSNFQFGKKRGNGSYYFSSFSHSWGWATWARTIDAFDLSMRGLEDFLSQGLSDFLMTEYGKKTFAQNFRDCAAGKVDTWDFPFRFSVWKNRAGLGILPNVNLIRNIGFNKNATHTSHESLLSARAVKSLGPMIHPDVIERNAEADRFYEELLKALHGDGLDFVAFFAAEIVRRTAEGDIPASENLMETLCSFYAGTRLPGIIQRIYEAARSTPG